MIIKNGNVFQEDGSFRKETLYIRNHRLTEAFEATSEEEVIDAEGLMVIPGLVDIHSHGAYGEDFSDGDPEGLKKILRYERQSGITSYCPTSMTLPKEQLKKIFKGIREAEKSGDGATVAGINMEGPFLDPVKKGAHVEEWITEPDADFVICSCMSQRYLYFTLHFPDKFHRTADIRCQRYQFNPSTGYFIQFPYKICIRFRDPFFDMCALLNRIQKRSFHIDTCNRCSIAGLFCFPDPFKNLLKLFLRKV